MILGNRIERCTQRVRFDNYNNWVWKKASRDNAILDE